MLDSTERAMPGWAETLARDMEWPCFHMPLWEAMGQHLRRNYQWIYGIQFGSWLLVLMSHTTPTNTLLEIVSRASIGHLPGLIVLVGMLLFYGSLLALGIYSHWASHNKKYLPAGHPGRLSPGQSMDAQIGTFFQDIFVRGILAGRFARGGSLLVLRPLG